MKKLLVLLLVAATLPGMMRAQAEGGTLRVHVTDASTAEPIPFANVIMKKDGATITGTSTDFDGYGEIKPVPPGTYDVHISTIGYEELVIKDVVITAAKVTALARDQTVLSPAATSIESFEVVSYSAPAMDIKRTSSLSVSSASSLGGTYSRDDGAGATSIRGARTDGGYYYIDGIKMRGAVGAADAKPLELEAVQFDCRISSLSLEYIGIKNALGSNTKASEKEKREANAGILTAGELHDFSKWEMWQDLNADELKQYKERWKLDPLSRYSVQLSFSSGVPVVDAEVILMKGKEKQWVGRTDNTGKAELWHAPFAGGEGSGKLSVQVNFAGETREVNNPVPFSEGINFVKLDGNCSIPMAVDIAFVVDATSSMSDEHQYLKAEVDGIINKVKSMLDLSEIRVGSVFYRDHGDDYLAQHSDFTADIDAATEYIRDQSAAGGGDYPEAVVDGLEHAIDQMQWSDQAAAKLLFLILDAPPHDDQERIKQLHEVVQRAAEKGVRIIPITASGIDKPTEYLMRSMALLTNGTYVFLTNHSGVGGDHIEPSTDSYDVELLSDLLQRLILQFTYVPSCESVEQAMADTGRVDSVNEVTGELLPEVEQEKEGEKKDKPKKDRTEPEALATWRFYPNPVRDILTAEISRSATQLMVTDLSGKIILRLEKTDTRFQLPMSNLPVGTYFIRFLLDEQWQTVRVVKV